MNTIVADTSELQPVMQILHAYAQQKSMVFLLQGDLASGKTTLVQYYARHIHLEEIPTSPTFTYQQVYGGVLYHYDLYQKELSCYLEQGLLEELEKEGIHFVEWGGEALQSILNRVGLRPVCIRIELAGDKRSYTIRHAHT
jgi:tRNA threonylcarbamoyladenosine biosynthesis protein TsaE